MSVVSLTHLAEIRRLLVAAIACWILVGAAPARGQESRRFEGELRHLAIDDMDERTGRASGRIVPILDLGNGEHRILDDPRQLLARKLSGRAILRGRAIDDQIVVDDVIDVVPSPQERIFTFPGGELGSQPTLVVLLKYADRPLEPFSLDDVRSTVLDAPDSADRFLRETSYGQTWLTPTFIDWRTLPRNAAEYGSPLDSLDDALELLDPEIDLTQFSRLVFVFESRPPDLAAIGIGTINRFYFFDPDDGRSFLASVAWIFANRSFVFAHELGHNLGLWHASSVACTPHNLQDPASGGGEGCAGSWSEYGDVDDAMGNTGYRHFSVRGKSQIGWLSLDQIPIADQSGEYLLRQVELASSGVKGLRIPNGRDDFGRPTYYWLEYRKGLGDFGGTADGGDVVQVRTHRAYTWRDDAEGVVQPSLNGLRPLSAGFVNVDVGKPFHDPYRGIDVELLEKMGTGAAAQARVRVTRSDLQFDPPETIDFGSAAPSSVELTATVKNGSAVPRQIGAASLEGRDASSWSIAADACSGHDIGPGQSCSIGLRFAPTVDQNNFATLVLDTDDDLRPRSAASLFGWGDLSPLDSDGNGTRDGLTDGVTLVRYLFGFRGAALTYNAIGPSCGRCTAAAIEGWLDQTIGDVDADGNGIVDPLTDGVLVLRWLLGLRRGQLVEGAVDLAGCTRCDTTTIDIYLWILSQ